MSTCSDNIFLSCRKGNIDRIKFLVERKEIDLNVRDCWDSTPLYYACHCGHADVVKYLLANGARCEENTFDGERCLYGALTNEIKQVLLNSKVADFGTQKLDDFDEFCKRLLIADRYSDFTLRLRGGKCFKLHRCVLSSRSTGLNSLLLGKWRNSNDVSNTIIEPTAFEAFIKYIYTGKLKCTRDDYDEVRKLAIRCQMHYIIPMLDQVMQQSTSFERSKKNIKVTTLLLDTTETREILEENFCSIIDKEMDDFVAREPFLHLSYCSSDDDEIDPTIHQKEMQCYYDICIKVDGTKFFCNKLFLCTRSEYFEALFQNHFDECHEFCNGIPVVSLKDFTTPVISCILYYIYSNKPHNLNEEIVFDVLEASDMFLLPGLTKLCGNFLCKVISTENAIDLLILARMRALRKLESSCVEFIGENLTNFYSDQKFRALIIEDANEVQGRQETDSIPIIDDIRYYIATSKDRYMWYPDDETCHSLKLIADLLDELELEA